MTSWREEILKHFRDPLPSLMVVSDPDRLLLEQKILDELRKKNLEVVEYEDPIRFRYLFETDYREKIASGRFCLVVHIAEETFERIPYDLQQKAVLVELRLADLFPKMSLPVLKQLTFEQLDALYTVYGQYQGSPSFSDTCDFLLRKIFKGSGYNEIETKLDLMEFLFRKHYEGLVYPELVNDFVVEKLKKKKELSVLPLKPLLSSSDYFYQFVQKEWNEFVKSYSRDPQFVKETGQGSAYNYFFLPGVKAILDNLFLEGKLSRLKNLTVIGLPSWIRIGIQRQENEEQKEKFDYFTSKLEKSSQETFTHKDWMKIAQQYGEWKYLSLVLSESLDQDDLAKIKQIEEKIDSLFEDWMCNHYPSIVQFPYLPSPVMVHHIPHYLKQKKRKDKIALVVLDGMSFVQWVQIKEKLLSRFHLEEQAVFAWVPTTTSVSRQAIFAGEPPYYFSDTFHTTQKEEAKWRIFWENHGVSRAHISFEKGLGQGSYNPDRIVTLQKPNTRVAGIVVDTIDRLIHGAIQGLEGIYKEIGLWLRNGYLEQLLSDLLNTGFDVYLTSDHGNKESIGIGKITEGILAETRGERVRVYSDPVLYEHALQKYPSIRWNNVGLPKNRYVLLAKSGEAFIIKDQVVVSHGGISLEEVIVPFVRVTEKFDES